MSKITTQTPPYHPGDIVIWPDGAWATLREVRNGGFSHRSDDFEIVPLDDIARLQELGLANELDMS
jgi:hypothetical protein